MKSKIKKVLLNIAKKHHGFMSFLRKGFDVYTKLKYRRFNKLKVDDKLIVFESFMGSKYADSPKSIYEYMISNDKYKDYKFVWFFTDPDSYKYLEDNSNTMVLKYKSSDYFKYYSMAGYWISNSRVMYILKKKKGQKYIQCWHGTPLKRLGFDIEVTGGNAMNSVKDIQDKYFSDAKLYDYMVSPSKFVTDKYKSAFNLSASNPNVKIIEKGYPRNDFISNFSDNDVKRIKKSLEIKTNKKIILYAPTWRDNQHESGLGYVYQSPVDFDYLKKKLGKEYIILFRAHYFVANSFNFDKYKGFVYDVSKYSDINDLYVISDLLITDYSSVFFDYSILKRPIIFYMYDLDDYKGKLRDFYINLSELPGEIVKTDKELVLEVEKSKKFSYNKKYKAFNDKFTYLEDGEATRRVVEEIFD